MRILLTVIIILIAIPTLAQQERGAPGIRPCTTADYEAFTEQIEEYMLQLETTYAALDAEDMNVYDLMLETHLLQIHWNQGELYSIPYCDEVIEFSFAYTVALNDVLVYLLLLYTGIQVDGAPSPADWALIQRNQFDMLIPDLIDEFANMQELISDND